MIAINSNERLWTAKGGDKKLSVDYAAACCLNARINVVPTR